jgi:hypothetical protein
MNSEQSVPSRFTRRGLLSTTLSVAAAGAASLVLPGDAAAGAGKPPQSAGHTYNGGDDPYPIPWLDKFGSHNQAAGPNMEPSHIYHFKGLVARCNGFVGMGTDNKGNRIAFGAPSTDYGIMQGNYWAARTEQTGAYVHI